MGATIIEPIPRKIPYTAISAYARDFEIGGEWFDMLVKLIRQIDEEYLEISAERSRERWEQQSR
jgi:hypothetical protein